MNTIIPNFVDVITITLILFAVIDIIGSIPIILSLKSKSGIIQPAKAIFICLIIMLIFLFVGESILHLIGIDINSFAVAGAFIIFFLAIEMIFGISFGKEQEVKNTNYTIVPISFPIIAGPGSITSILSLRAEYEIVNIVIAIIINLILVYFVLRFSKYIERLLGKSGIEITKKIFGIILLAIAIKLFTSNINQLLN